MGRGGGSPPRFAYMAVDDESDGQYSEYSLMNEESLDIMLRSLEADMQSNDDISPVIALDEASWAKPGTTDEAMPPASRSAATIASCFFMNAPPGVVIYTGQQYQDWVFGLLTADHL